jgi:hypothetical protein
METRDRDRPPAMSRRQRWMFVAYWAVVGAISGVVNEAVLAHRAAGVWEIEPLKMAFRSIGMAITIGGAFWILSQPAESEMERRS